MQTIFHFKMSLVTFNASVLQYIDTTVCIQYCFNDIFSSFHLMYHMTRFTYIKK